MPNKPDQVKLVLLMGVPMSICNLRCHYCYLSQRSSAYEGKQPQWRFTPEQVALALSPERLGGQAFMNFCADGETLLTKGLDEYIRLLLLQGHYIEFVTNMTITSALSTYLSWDRELLGHLEFKCSFHYLELKKRGLLDTFVRNVKSAWEAGASCNIEITPSDELIPYIDEVKAFSMEHFGALPHLTIARNDRDPAITYLTGLDQETYDETWRQFDSGFWEFKRQLFGVKRTEFCYAGQWSMYVNFATGEARQCYCGSPLGNLFADPTKPVRTEAIGKCLLPHCYNGHALLSLGLIPDLPASGYGDLRDRERTDGSHWLQPKLKAFFNTKLKDGNPRMRVMDEKLYFVKRRMKAKAKQAKRKVKRFLKNAAAR